MVMLLYGKIEDIYDIYSQTVPPRIFAAHFFTIEDASHLEKSLDENIVIRNR